MFIILPHSLKMMINESFIEHPLSSMPCETCNSLVQGKLEKETLCVDDKFKIDNLEFTTCENCGEIIYVSKESVERIKSLLEQYKKDRPTIDFIIDEAKKEHELNLDNNFGEELDDNDLINKLEEHFYTRKDFIAFKGLREDSSTKMITLNLNGNTSSGSSFFLSENFDLKLQEAHEIVIKTGYVFIDCRKLSLKDLFERIKEWQDTAKLQGLSFSYTEGYLFEKADIIIK